MNLWIFNSHFTQWCSPPIGWRAPFRHRNPLRKSLW